MNLNTEQCRNYKYVFSMNVIMSDIRTINLRLMVASKYVYSNLISCAQDNAFTCAQINYAEIIS